MSTSSNSGPQLNQLRSNFNELVAKKKMIGSSKRVVWASRRRYSNI